MEIENDSSSGMYPMPDPALAYAKAGAAFKGASWVHDVAYQQSDEVNAAANLLRQMIDKQADTPKLGTNDIANICSEIAALLESNGVSKDTIDKAIASIKSQSGSATSRADLMAVAQQIAATAVSIAHDENTQTAMNAQQFEREMKEIANLDKQISHILQDSMTEEEKKKDEEFQHRLSTAKSDQERLSIEQEYGRFQKHVVHRMEDGTEQEQKTAEDAKPFIDKRDEGLANIRGIQFNSPNKSVHSEPNVEKQTESLVSPKLAVSFGGFDKDSATVAAPDVAKQVKAHVAASHDVSFSGFEVADSSANVPNVKQSNINSRQV